MSKKATAPVNTAADAEFKRRTAARLSEYRKIHGLGCYDRLALPIDGLTSEAIRNAVGGWICPMETWRRIAAALDKAERKKEANCRASS